MNLDFSKLRILVYGDVMLDEYVHGVIERISPEAPVPVLSRTHSEHRPGGAANVAANVAALGAQVTLCGVVGDDDEADLLAASIPANVERWHAQLADRTTHKTRYLAQHNHCSLRVDTECGDVDEDGIPALIGSLQPEFDAIIVSDYAKGAVTKGAMKELCAKDVPIFVDPKHSDWSLYNGASWFTPNEKEWAESTGRLDLAKGVLITRAERGMSLICNQDISHCDAVAQQVADVTGAGDTVIAAFTCAVTAGNDPVDAMRFANAAAGVAVSKSGTATVTIDEATAALAA